MGTLWKGMAIMTDMMQDLFERVAKQAEELTKITHKAAMSEEDIKALPACILSFMIAIPFFEMPRSGCTFFRTR
jgi:hypothetical protein